MMDKKLHLHEYVHRTDNLNPTHFKITTQTSGTSEFGPRDHSTRVHTTIGWNPNRSYVHGWTHQVSESPIRSSHTIPLGGGPMCPHHSSSHSDRSTHQSGSLSSLLEVQYICTYMYVHIMYVCTMYVYNRNKYKAPC